VLSLTARSIGECVIGDSTKPAPKTNPEDGTSIPGGEDIINFLENLVMCREFFDKDSTHTGDMRCTVQNVKIARRQNFRVVHVWVALKTMFQCCHQRMQLFATMSVVMDEPRATGSYEASDRLWAKGASHAMMAGSIGPAWRRSSLDSPSGYGDCDYGSAGASALSPADRKAASKLLRSDARDNKDDDRDKGSTSGRNKSKKPKVPADGDDEPIVAATRDEGLPVVQAWQRLPCW
jgi:hypothetical protein